MLIITPDYVTETIAPTIEPVSIAEARDHLRVSIDDDDLLIRNSIKAARRYTEAYCGRSFAQHTYRADISGFWDERPASGNGDFG